MFARQRAYENIALVRVRQNLFYRFSSDLGLTFYKNCGSGLVWVHQYRILEVLV